MKVEIYKRKGEWRWRLVARNGRTLAVSSESYKRKSHCVRMLRLTLNSGIKAYREVAK